MTWNAFSSVMIESQFIFRLDQVRSNHLLACPQSPSPQRVPGEWAKGHKSAIPFFQDMVINERTILYRFRPLWSVKTMISLHRNTLSLRPLFALASTPCLTSFLAPICLVGAVRSSRLNARYQHEIAQVEEQ